MKKYQVREELSQESREELREYSDLLAHLLYHRGIKTKDEADNFLNLSYEKHVHDPFLMKGMGEAVDILLKALKENKKIAVFSDYDADGIPGAVVLTDFLRKIDYENYFVYIPHRNKEGFGLNMKAIDEIKERGADLIITIDCGIADVSEVQHVRDLGMEIIITDHHEANGHAPNANAIVNHKQEGCEYPEKILCGSGVVFKFVQALVQKGDHDIPEGWEKTLLDMVGVATLSDMVPLKGENRALAKFGLTILKMSPRRGLHKLLKKTGTKQKDLDEDDIGFTISPRINAASRMGEPEIAYKMLSTQDEVEAGMLVNHLHEINDQRKGHVAAMVKDIRKYAKDAETPVVVFGKVEWKPSLLGLAASKIAEEFNKPVFLWGRGEGKDLKGSCRSANGYSLIEIMNGVNSETFEVFGGHNEAGGFVLKKDRVDFLRDDLVEAFNKLDEKDSNFINWVDKSLDIKDLNRSLFEEILKLSPFGMKNEKPLFIFENVSIKKVELFGKAKDHLKIIFEGTPINAIAFFRKPESFEKDFKEGDNINLIAHIEKDFFGGNNRLRLRIIDII